MDTEKSNMNLANSVVNVLLRKGVKLLALDFDKTIVSVHTAGLWRQGAHKLAEHVRPCFKVLLKTALDSRLHVCVVTYSMQPDLIRDVLKIVLMRSDVNKIMIRANSKDWYQRPSIMQRACLGKQHHLAWAVTELFNRKHVIIQPHEILLMDDDEDNVTLAQECGHQAFEVTDDITMEDIHGFVEGLSVQKITVTVDS